MNRIVPTVNNYGWTTNEINPITQAMLADIGSRGPEARVLDVGAAYGVAAIPALRRGAFVYANDIDEVHLAVLREAAASEGMQSRLQIVHGRFPAITQLHELSAVHCSNVLHFLDGEELRKAMAFAYEALQRGGKLFIQIGTPFAGHVQAFLGSYELRSLRGDEWPGIVNNAREIIRPELRHQVPAFLHLFDKDTLIREVKRVGLRILEATYYTRPGLPELCRHDGRENLGVIALKPE